MNKRKPVFRLFAQVGTIDLDIGTITMVSEERVVLENPSELVSSFQVLNIVAEALSQIQTGSDPAVVTPTIARIQQKFKQCEGMLDKLPCGGMTKQDQLDEIQRLRDSLKRKRDLVERYSRHHVISRVLSQRNLSLAGKDGSENPMPGVNNGNETGDRSQPTNHGHAVADTHMIDHDFGDVPGLGKDSANEVLLDLDL